jgi:hypothetical protein
MPQAWIQFARQVLMIHFPIDMKPLQHQSLEAHAVRAFERVEVADTAIKQLR